MGSDLEASMRTLAEGLRGRASSEAEREVGVPFNPRVDDSLSLLDHGEAVVGFENLLSNIYEFDVVVTEKEVDLIEMLATAWQLADDQWTFIKNSQR